jgi:hypothetical protein
MIDHGKTNKQTHLTIGLGDEKEGREKLWTLIDVLGRISTTSSF